MTQTMEDKAKITSYNQVKDEVREKYRGFFGQDVPSEVEGKISIVEKIERGPIIYALGEFIESSGEIRVVRENQELFVSSVMHEFGHYRFLKDCRPLKEKQSLISRIKDCFNYPESNNIRKSRPTYYYLSEVAALYIQFKTCNGDARNPQSYFYGDEVYDLAGRLYKSKLDKMGVWNTLTSIETIKGLYRKFPRKKLPE